MSTQTADNRSQVARATGLIEHAAGVAVLSGAGMSTDSGIPDYRGPNAPKASPMLYSEFVSSLENRRRYWARAFRGWARMGRALPNQGHRLVAEFERDGMFDGVITQNVDGLHESAGSRNLVALHGRISDVTCLVCGDVTDRESVQQEMARLNPDVLLDPRAGHAELRPDGDAVVSDWQGFVVPGCRRCGGMLKPDVVFFGENVPKPRVEQCFAMVDQAEVLLVLGSSLTVMSGLRFVWRAARADKPVIIVNRGQTRGDDMATVKLAEGCAEFLTELRG